MAGGVRTALKRESIGQGRKLADGTPRELKTSLERDVLEVEVATKTDLTTARDILGGSAVVPVQDQLMLHLPIGDGSPPPLAALRGLQDAGVAVTEFQLRRPTLDDVFLTLTEEQPA